MNAREASSVMLEASGICCVQVIEVGVPGCDVARFGVNK